MSKKNDEITLNNIPATSPDLRKDMLDKIREIYPTLFGEDNALNTKELQSFIDDYSKPEAERYSFPWAGKTASKRFAFTPSKARLVPDKERSVDFDMTQNLIIEGENLEVLKLLQASYFKKVKMIYIDPPYNTGHDFVYSDDYSESRQAYWEKNGVYHDGVRMDTNTESSGRYHSNWLSMMQSRLLLARNLLRDDGVIFVSIGDEEVHNLRRLLDEIFGEENFEGHIHWRRRSNQPNDPTKMIGLVAEHVLVYAKYSILLKKYGVGKVELTGKFSNPDNDARGDWASKPWKVGAGQSGSRYTIKTYAGIELNEEWMGEEETFRSLLADNRIIFPDKGKGAPRKKYFKNEREVEGQSATNWWNHDQFGSNQEGTDELATLMGGKVIFDNPKPVRLIKSMMQLANLKSGDLVVDFFAGSGTTGQSVLELNKNSDMACQFILVQLPEAIDEKEEAIISGYKTISQITIERMKRAGAKIKSEKPSVDVGFKTLQLTKSLFPQNLFEVDPDMTEEQRVKAWEIYLEKSNQAHFFDFKPDELLVEIALKDGFDLNYKVEPMKEFKKNKVLDVSDGEKTALICLDATLEEETIKALDTFKERRFICLERSVDSTRKWNLKRMFGDNLWVA